MTMKIEIVGGWGGFTPMKKKLLINIIEVSIIHCRYIAEITMKLKMKMKLHEDEITMKMNYNEYEISVMANWLFP